MDLASLIPIFADPTKLTAKTMGTLKNALQVSSESDGSPASTRARRRIPQAEHLSTGRHAAQLAQLVSFHQNATRLIASLSKSMAAVNAKGKMAPLGPLWTRRREYICQAYACAMECIQKVEGTLIAAGADMITALGAYSVEKRISNYITTLVDTGLGGEGLAAINTLIGRIQAALGGPGEFSRPESRPIFRIPHLNGQLQLTPDLVQLCATSLQHYLRFTFMAFRTDPMALTKAFVQTISPALMPTSSGSLQDNRASALWGDLGFWQDQLIHSHGLKVAQTQIMAAANLLTRITEHVKDSRLLPLISCWLLKAACPIRDACAYIMRAGIPATPEDATRVLVNLGSGPPSNDQVAEITKLVAHWCSTSGSGHEEIRKVAWHWFSDHMSGRLASSLDSLPFELTIDMICCRLTLGDPESEFADRIKPLEQLLARLRGSKKVATGFCMRQSDFVAQYLLRVGGLFVTEAGRAVAAINKMDDSENPFNSSYTYFKALVHDSISLLVAALFPLYSSAPPVARSLFEWLLYLAQLMFDQNRQDAAMSYMSKAVELCESVAQAPEADGAGRSRAASYARASDVCNAFAMRLMAIGSFHAARQPAQLSVSLLERCNAQSGAAQSKSSTGKSSSNYANMPEHGIALAKRYELLYSIDALVENSPSKRRSSKGATHGPASIRTALELVVMSGDRREIHALVSRYVRLERSANSKKTDDSPAYQALSSMVRNHWVYFSEWQVLHAFKDPARETVLDSWCQFCSKKGQSSIMYAHALICHVANAGGLECEKECREAIELLKAIPKGTDTDKWGRYKLDLLATAYCYLAFIEHDSNHLTTAFQLFKAALQDSTQELLSIQDTAFHLQLIETILLSRSQYSLLLLLYQIMILLEPTDDVKAHHLVSLATVLLELGYYSQAGLSLSTASSFLSNSDRSQGRWNATYSLYLTLIGNLSKSATILDDIEGTPAPVRSHGRKSRGRCDERTMARLANRIARKVSQIQLLVARGQGIEAMIMARNALSLTKRLDGKNVLYIFQVVELMAQLYLWAGLWQDGELYAKKGLAMANEYRNCIMACRFCTLLGNIAQRKGMLEEASNLLRGQRIFTQGKADSSVDSSSPLEFADLEAKETVLRLLRLGETSLAKISIQGDSLVGSKSLDAKAAQEAEGLSSQARSLLHKLKDRVHVTDLISDPAYTPRIRKLLPVTGENGDKLRARNLIQYDVELSALQAAILRKSGKLQDAERSMTTTLKSINLLCPIKPIYYLNVACVSMELIEPYLRREAALEALQDSVMVLDSNDFEDVLLGTEVPREGNASARGIDDRLMARIQFSEQLLNEALQECSDITPPSVLHQIGHHLLYIHAIKSALGKSTAASISDILESSCHGVTQKRWHQVINPESGKASYGQTKDKSVSTPPRVANVLSSVTPTTQFFGEQRRTPDHSASRRFSATPCRLKRDSIGGGILSLHLEMGDAEEEASAPQLELPGDWTVCRMSVDPERQVLLLATQRGTKQYVTVRLPLRRMQIRGSRPNAPSVQSAVRDLDAIIKANDNMLKDSYETREDKMRWWTERGRLDRELFALLSEVESSWLGAFRGLLDGETHPNGNRFLAELHEYLNHHGAGRNSSQAIVPLQFAHAWLRLGIEPSQAELEDIGCYILDECQKRGLHVTADLDGSPVNPNASLPRGIQYDDLIQFLQRQLRVQNSNVAKAPCSVKHVVLVLDKHISSLPWESTTQLRGKSVSRVFSVENLYDILKKHTPKAKAKCSSVYYILNPSGDLGDTEEAFASILSQRNDWGGVSGRMPANEAFLKQLQTADVFLYFGHGGSETVCPPKKILGLARGPMVNFLMGCSSGRLSAPGEFDPMGTALNYLVKSPCVVANLWDVTDKDIDRFALSALRRWGLFPSTPSVPGESAAMGAPGSSKAEVASPSTSRIGPDFPTLASAMATARNDCHFQYLIGAAPVMYGIPIHLV